MWTVREDSSGDELISDSEEGEESEVEESSKDDNDKEETVQDVSIEDETQTVTEEQEDVLNIVDQLLENYDNFESHDDSEDIYGNLVYV